MTQLNTQIAHEDKLEVTYYVLACWVACICLHVVFSKISPKPSVRAVKYHLSPAWRSPTSPASAHLPVSTIRASVKKEPVKISSSATKYCNHLQSETGEPTPTGAM